VDEWNDGFKDHCNCIKDSVQLVIVFSTQDSVQLFMTFPVWIFNAYQMSQDTRPDAVSAALLRGHEVPKHLQH